MRKEKLLGENAIQSLRKNEMVGIAALDKICSMLDIQPGEIIEYKKSRSCKRWANKRRYRQENQWTSKRFKRGFTRMTIVIAVTCHTAIFYVVIYIIV